VLDLRGERLQKLMDDCLSDYGDHPELTVKNLRNFLRRFYRWLDGRELTVKECRAYVKDMQRRLAYSSASSDTGRLQMFLKWLHYEAEVTTNDWARDVRRPKRDKNPKPPEQLLSPEKIIQYIHEVTEPGKHDHVLHRKAKNEHRAFLLFYCRMGLRPNEAIQIKPENVNLDGDPPSVAVSRKGRKWRTLGLPLDYLEPIRERIEEGRWFKVSQKTLQVYMQRISVLAGQKVKLYSIRKRVDTSLLDNGADLMRAAEHQGHTVAIMQKDYVKFSAKQSSEVNNTYNPFIDRSKIPAAYMMKKLMATISECEHHPEIKVVKSKGKIVIEYPKEAVPKATY